MTTAVGQTNFPYERSRGASSAWLARTLKLFNDKVKITGRGNHGLVRSLLPPGRFYAVARVQNVLYIYTKYKLGCGVQLTVCKSPSLL